MIDLNYLAVFVAALAVFVLSSVYYILFSQLLAQLSAAYSDTSRPPAWKLAAEVARSIVVAAVVAGLATLLGITDWVGALLLGFALWVGFPVVLLSGAVIHENEPWKIAVIHAGDWLLKVLVIAVIVSVWR
ncbi:MAG: DUF1761 domain-containing protein [Gemmatimonadales bacterium]